MFASLKDEFFLASPEEKKDKLWNDTFLLILLLDCIASVFLIPYSYFEKIIPLHSFNLFIGNLVFMVLMFFLFMLRDNFEKKTIWIFLAVADVFFCIMLYVRATQHFTDIYVPFFAFLPLLISIFVASEYLPGAIQFLTLFFNSLAILLFQDAIYRLFQLETVVYLCFLFLLFSIVHFLFSFIFFFIRKENIFYKEERSRNQDMRQQTAYLQQEKEVQVQEMEKMLKVFTRYKSGDLTVRLATNNAAYQDLYAVINASLAKQEKLVHDGDELENIKNLATQLAGTIHHQNMMNVDLSLVKTGTCLDMIVAVLNKDQKTKDLFTL